MSERESVGSGRRIRVAGAIVACLFGVFVLASGIGGLAAPAEQIAPGGMNITVGAGPGGGSGSIIDGDGTSDNQPAIGDEDGEPDSAPSAGDVTRIANDRPLQANDERVHFVVSAEQPAYWRVAAYDRYQGNQWEKSEESPVHETPPGDRSREVLFHEIQFKIPADAVPTGGRPVDVGGVSSGFNYGSESEVYLQETAEPGSTVTVTSLLPETDLETLQSAGSEYPAAIEERYTALPDWFPERVRERTAEITADADTPLETATTIESWFRSNYEYAPDAPSINGNVTEEILFEREEIQSTHVASAMAAMLRSEGIPTRYVVGYNSGNYAPSNDTYVVRGIHAHAWVEVYFPDSGWVPFDPTPTQDRAETLRQTVDSEPAADEFDYGDRERLEDSTSDGEEGELEDGEQSGEESSSDGTEEENSDGGGGDEAEDGEGGESGNEESNQGGQGEDESGEGEREETGQSEGDESGEETSQNEDSGQSEGDESGEGGSQEGDGENGAQSGDSEDGTEGEESEDNEQNEDGSQSEEDGTSGQDGDSKDGSQSETGEDNTQGEESGDASQTGESEEGTADEEGETGDDGAAGEGGKGQDGAGGGNAGTQPGESSDSGTQTNDSNNSGQNPDNQEQNSETNDYRIELLDDPIPGQTLRVRVTQGENPVGEIPVTFNGTVIGQTNTSGIVSETVPFKKLIEIAAYDSDAERPVNASQTPLASKQVSLPTEITIRVEEPAHPGTVRNVTAEIENYPIERADVYVDGQLVKRTDQSGKAGIKLPDREGTVSIRIQRGAALGNKTVQLSNISIAVNAWPAVLPGTTAEVTVTYDDGTPVKDAVVFRDGIEVLKSNNNGAGKITATAAFSSTITAERGTWEVGTTVNPLRNLLFGLSPVVLVVLLSMALARWAGYRPLVRFSGGLRQTGRRLISTVIRASSRLAQAVSAVEWPKKVRYWPVAVIRTIINGIIAAVGGVYAAVSSGVLVLRKIAPGQTTEPSDEQTTDKAGTQSRSVTIVRRSWNRLVALSPVSRPATHTPTDIADRAIEAGLPREPVETILSTFQSVEYGTKPQDETREDKITQAMDSLDDGNE